MSYTTGTSYAPLERNRWFEDADGIMSTSKHEDDILQMVIDWADWLASGETVSTATYADSGVTTSSKSVSGTTTTCNVTGLGETEITITTSSSRRIVRKRRFCGMSGMGAMDYR